MTPSKSLRPFKAIWTGTAVINLIMVVFASFFTIMYNNHIFHVDSKGFGVAGLFYAVRYLPIMLTAALGGAIPGMISVLIVFIYRSLVGSSFSYLTFIYLLVVIVVDVVTRRKWFNRWYKALAVCAFMQNLVGTFWGIVILLMSGQGLETLSLRQCVLFFMNELPGCLLSSLLIYFIFKKLPDEKKKLLNNGKYYIEYSKLSDDERYEVEGRSKLGLVVMNIIVIEALFLGISAEVASNTLVPTIKNYGYVRSQSSVNNYAELGSVERLESSVSSELIEESRYEALLLTNSITGKNTINYRSSIRLAMLISIIVIPLAVFVNRYAQRRIAEPIRVLSKAISKVYNAHDETLGSTVGAIHDLDIETGDEIEELYHAVDLTVYRLVEYIELVRNRQAIEDQLKIAKSANEAKSRFLSNISHEIRTPINAVLGFDEMILRQSKDKEILDYASDIQSSGKTLLALINDILDFSKIESGSM